MANKNIDISNNSNMNNLNSLSSEQPIGEIDHIDNILSVRITGLSIRLQRVIINDIILKIYSRLLHDEVESMYVNDENFISKLKILNIEEFFDAQLNFFDKVLKIAGEVNYSNFKKIQDQVDIIKTNKIKFIELVNHQIFQLSGTYIDAKKEFIYEEFIKKSPENAEVYFFRNFEIFSQLNFNHELRFIFSNICDSKIEFKHVRKESISDENLKYIDNIKIINKRIPLQLLIKVEPHIVVTDLINVLIKSNFNEGLSNISFKFNQNLNLQPKIQLVIHLLKQELIYKPYFINLISKLENLTSQSQQEFIQNFNCALTNHITILEHAKKDRCSLRIIGSVMQEDKLTLIEEWKNNLKNQDSYIIDANKTFLKHAIIDDFNEAYEKLQSFRTLYTIRGNSFKKMYVKNNNYIGFKNLFQIIGIHFTEQAYECLIMGIYVDGKAKSIENQFEHSNGLMKLIKKRLSFVIENNVEGSLMFNDNVFTKIANFLIKFKANNAFNISYKNNNGYVKKTIIYNNYFIERFINIKFNQTLLIQLNANPFSKSSYWLSQLFNQQTQSNYLSEFHKIFKYYIIDEYKSTYTSKSVDNLDKKELIKLKLSLFYNHGYTISKGQVPVHKFIVALKNKSLIIQAIGKHYNLFNGKLCVQDAKFLRSQLFVPEALRILNSQKNGVPNISNYKINAFKFNVFSKFNDVNELWTDGKLIDDVLENEKYNEIIDNIILSSIQIEFQKLYESWAELNLLSRGRKGICNDKMDFIDDNYAQNLNSKYETNFNQATKVVLNYIINYLVANANLQMIFFNDKAFDLKEKINVLSDFNDVYLENFKHKAEIINEDKHDFNFPIENKFNVLILKDNINKCQELKYISLLCKYQSKAFNKIDDWSEMITKESLEYTNLQEHLNRLVYSGLLAENEAKRIFKLYQIEGEISKLDLKKILFLFQTFYYNSYMINSTMIPLCIRSLSLPLIKQFTLNTDFEELRKHMEKNENNLQFAVVESGIMEGKIETPLEIFNKNGKIIQRIFKSAKIDGAIIKNVPREGHGFRVNY